MEPHPLRMAALAARVSESPAGVPALRPVTRTSPTKAANELLFELLRARRQLAVVYDEHSRLVGLVTMEDLLEELVGDIRDEHDEPATDSSAGPQA